MKSAAHPHMVLCLLRPRCWVLDWQWPRMRWRWGMPAFAALWTTACLLPSANVGRPVSPGTIAGTVAVGVDSTQVQYDRHPAVAASSVLISEVVGGRVGLLPGWDIGAESSLTHLGFSTRLQFVELSRLSAVWTLDARIAHGGAEDESNARRYPGRYATTRILLFADWTSDVSWLLGAETGAGRYPYITGVALLDFYTFTRDEWRAGGLLGVSYVRRFGQQQHREFVLFVNGYHVVEHSSEYPWLPDAGVLIAFTGTFDLAQVPKIAPGSAIRPCDPHEGC